MSCEPLSNEVTIRLEYMWEYVLLQADGDIHTVHPWHTHQTHLVVRLKARSELATTEALSATSEVNA